MIQLILVTIGPYHYVLCNYYKRISQTLSSKLKPILLEVTSQEQMGFSKGRYIKYVIGIA
jgi:hypothetical protein